MKADSHTTFSVYLGRALGRTWRAGERLDRKARDWLVALGLGASMAKGISWALKLALFAILLYGAFWLGLLLAFAVIGAWLAQHADLEQDDRKPEWKEGHEGFGLYDKSDWRIDMGDPDGP